MGWREEHRFEEMAVVCVHGLGGQVRVCVMVLWAVAGDRCCRRADVLKAPVRCKSVQVDQVLSAVVR